MICKMCGKTNPESSGFCSGCGASLIEPLLNDGEVIGEESAEEVAEAMPESAPQSPPNIKSHMAAAIITTILFGNWILGIPAIVFARECEIAWQKAQYDISERFSRRAMTFMCVGVALCLALWAFLALAMVVYIQLF